MAVVVTKTTTTTMNTNAETPNNKEEDGHEHDMVMPGFRFHPTEEELVEFYLRRKVDGKKFNVELITFLDLYRYDPWELPAMAAIGEKEWYFYVPRDRKYRNGDRPNRVTTSGYWKATGADRSIRGAIGPIGLKKTLVFYSGKAPKGIRTSWIMNEYRLPQHDTTHKHHKAEISLCRVYKRPGVEDHVSIPRAKSKNLATPAADKKGSDTTNTTTTTTTDASSSSDVALGGLSNHHHQHQNAASSNNNYTALSISNQLAGAHLPMNPPNFLNGFMINPNPGLVDDLQSFQNHQHFHPTSAATASPSTMPLFSGFQPSSSFPPISSTVAGFTDRLWEWNAVVPPEPPQPQPNFNAE